MCYNKNKLRDNMKLTPNELMILRGTSCWKRMYKGMKHAPHGVVVWDETWMQDSLDKINAYIKEHHPEIPDWK